MPISTTNTPPEVHRAIEIAQLICAELESGVVSGPSGGQYRQDAIYDLADAARVMSDALTTRRRLEFVTYRDRDDNTRVQLIVDVIEIAPEDGR